MSILETYCARQVKAHDYDRFLVTLFAPSEVREDLFALYAFNHEVAKIREAVSEPMLGEIRLQWWREAIEGIYDGSPRNHEVVLPLEQAVKRSHVSSESFMKIIDARTADIYDDNPATLADFENYLGSTSGNLTRLAAEMLGERDEQVLSMAYDLGLVWGLIGTIRAIRYHISLSKISLPQELMDEFNITKNDVFSMEENVNLNSLIKALYDSANQYLEQISNDKSKLSKEMKSLFLLSALSRSYLNTIKGVDYNPFAIDERAGMFPRQCRLFFSALFGLV
ncbi:MAG: phytoene/squalene synthase family protein [Emcibacteraceae bacterium]|nr:phytoene/squalene synthase family protein [Emcibacteraceae bacterium]